MNRPSCPVLPLKSFVPCDVSALDEVVHALRDAKEGNFDKAKISDAGCLDMCKQAIGVEGTERILAALEEAPHIDTLLLGTNGLGDDGAQHIAKYLQSGQPIKTLYLGCNGITSTGAEALASALVGNPHVAGLWLKRNPIKKEGAFALAEAFRSGCQLRVLDLVHTGIDISGFCEILNGLKAGKTPLTHAYFGGNGFDASCIPPLLDWLQHTPSLRSLSLSASFLADDGIEQLLTTPHTKQLRELAIGSNGATAKGIASISPYNMPHLTRIDLGSVPSERITETHANNIGDAGAENLSQKLPHWPALQALNLRGCGISAAGMKPLLAAIVRHPSLRLIDARLNEISPHQINTIKAFHRHRPEAYVAPLVSAVRSAFR